MRRFCLKISAVASMDSSGRYAVRLQNSPYFVANFVVFKYARAVKQKVWNEAENRERDWGEKNMTHDSVIEKFALNSAFWNKL